MEVGLVYTPDTTYYTAGHWCFRVGRCIRYNWSRPSKLYKHWLGINRLDTYFLEARSDILLGKGLLLYRLKTGSRVAFINQCRQQYYSSSTNASKQANKLPTPILACKYNATGFKRLTSYDTLYTSCLTNNKAFLILIIGVFISNTIFLDPGS